jgi:hypothetical protein
MESLRRRYPTERAVDETLTAKMRVPARAIVHNRSMASLRVAALCGWHQRDSICSERECTWNSRPLTVMPG